MAAIGNAAAIFDPHALQYKGQLHSTFEELRVRRLTDGHEVVLEFPEQDRVASAKLSPDGNLVANTLIGTERVNNFETTSLRI